MPSRRSSRVGAKRMLVAMLCLTSAPSALSRTHAIEAELTAVLSAYTAHREDDRSGRTLLTDASALQSSQEIGAQQAPPDNASLASDIASAVGAVTDDADAADAVRQVATFEELKAALAQGSPLVEITDHIHFPAHDSVFVRYVGNPNVAIWGRCATLPSAEELPAAMTVGGTRHIPQGTCHLRIPSSAMTRVNAMFTARGYQLKNVWLSNVIMSEWGREVKRTRNVGLKGVRASRSRLWLTQSVLANFGGSAVDLSGNDAMLSDVLLTKGYTSASDTVPDAALRAFAVRTLDMRNCRIVDTDAATPGPALSIVSVSPLLTLLRLEDLTFDNYAQTNADVHEIDVAAGATGWMPQFFVQYPLRSVLQETATSGGRQAPYYPLTEWPSTNVLDGDSLDWLSTLVEVKVPGAEAASYHAHQQALRTPSPSSVASSKRGRLSSTVIALISSLVTCAVLLLLTFSFMHFYKRRPHASGRPDPYTSVPVTSTATTPGTGAHTVKSHFANSPTFLDRLHAGLEKLGPSSSNPPLNDHIAASHTAPPSRSGRAQASAPAAHAPPAVPSEYWLAHSVQSSTRSISGSIPLELLPPRKPGAKVHMPSTGAAPTQLYSDGNFAVLHRINLHVKC